MGTLEIVVSIITGLVGSIIAAECLLSAEPFANFLVRRAARSLPAIERDRYEAEWLQVIRDIRSPLGKLAHAINLCLRARSIASALGARQPSSLSQASIRTLDILISAFAIALFFPAWVVIALCIKLESSGPVLYRQLRRGKGKTFFIYKFRTKSVTNNPGDARLTAVGYVLRAASMDETPQLLNVLAGHMSFVGPRPRPVDHNANLRGSDVEIEFRPGLVPLPKDEKGKVDLRMWMKCIWSAVQNALTGKFHSK
jgi:hypothetical protein